MRITCSSMIIYTSSIHVIVRVLMGSFIQGKYYFDMINVP